VIAVIHDSPFLPAVAHPLALDVGTATVRVWTPGLDCVLSEPAVIGRDRRGRRVAGRTALEYGTDLVWPMSDGVVHDFYRCVRLLRMLVVMAGRPHADLSPVLVGVPATATLREKNLMVTAVRRATGSPVTAVDEPLAAALACRLSPRDGDVVAVDIGHGRTEVARITEQTVTAAERVDIANTVDQVPAIATAVRRIGVSAEGHRRLLLTGGGATLPGVAARLAASTRRAVTVPVQPRLATVTGLRLLLTG
jgi:actin-like ATPase involved in cell morphogenesis